MTPPSRLELELTISASVTTEVAEKLWELHVLSFEPLRALTATRQRLTRDEFFSELNDERVVKIYVSDAEGNIWASCFFTHEAEAFTWVEPAFYAAKYPEETAKGVVVFCGVTAVHPDKQRSSCLMKMTNWLVNYVAERHGVLAFDIARFNRDHLHFHKGTERLGSKVAEVRMDEVDSQHYFTYSFDNYRGPGSDSLTR